MECQGGQAECRSLTRTPDARRKVSAKSMSSRKGLIYDDGSPGLCLAGRIEADPDEDNCPRRGMAMPLA